MVENKIRQIILLTILTISIMDCLQFYQQFLSNSNLLANGHELIKNYLLGSPTNRSSTLLNILTPSPPILVLVGNVYPSVFPSLDEQEKTKTRIYLIELLFKMVSQSGVSSKESQSLMALIARIHNEQGYDKWLSIYAEFIKSIPPQFFASFIITLLQSADNRISTLSVNIFAFIIQSYQSQQLTQTSTEELFQIIYYCLRTFSHLTGTDDNTLQTYYNPYQEWMLKFIWGNLLKSPICMKFGFKILTVLYGDMNRFDQEDNANIINLFSYGMQLLQQYLKLSTDIRFCNNIEQQQEQENDNTQLSANFPVILYQLLELYQIVVQKLEDEEAEEESKTNKVPVLLFSLLLTIPTRADLELWHQNTDQYLMAIEDEYERNLRNRANTLIVALLEESDEKDIYIQVVRDYFGAIASNVNSVGKAEGLINQKNKTNVTITIPVQPTILQQSSYFILASTISSLYSTQYRNELLKYLRGRATQSNNVLIQIITTYITVNQMKQPFQEEQVNFILQTITNNKTVYQRKEDIGLAIGLAKGLGKICCGKGVVLGQAVPVEFVQLLTSYIMSNKSGKPDEDGTYIVLELFVKLTECNPQNKIILASIITPDVELFMINNYMHDGLLSSIVLKLLEHYPHQATVNTIANTLLTGHIREEKYCELIATWLKSSTLSLTSQHIEQLLLIYKPPNHTIITPILKLYISSIKSNPTQLTASIRQLLNKHPDQVLLVPLLGCNILENVQQRLLQTIKNIVYEETSQYEIEKKMMLVFYCGIYETGKLVGLLQSEAQLYHNFHEKLFKYARLFNGSNLRIVTSIFFLKLTEVDPALSKQSVSLISSYGNLETNEWEEEEEEQEQADMIERLINCKLENDELQKELGEVFNDLLGTGQGSEYIQKRIQQLQ